MTRHISLWTDLGVGGFEIDALLSESALQVKKWGVQCDTPHKWLGWLHEEAGELAKAINKVYSDTDKADIDKQDIFKEAVQVATLALKIARMYRAEYADAIGKCFQ